jgi:hypothetical protein
MKKEKIKIMIRRRVTVDVVFKFFLSSSIFFSSSTHIIPLDYCFIQFLPHWIISSCFTQTIWEWSCLYRFLFFYILLNVPVVNVMNMYE